MAPLYQDATAETIAFEYLLGRGRKPRKVHFLVAAMDLFGNNSLTPVLNRL